MGNRRVDLGKSGGRNIGKSGKRRNSSQDILFENNNSNDHKQLQIHSYNSAERKHLRTPEIKSMFIRSHRYKLNIGYRHT